MKQVEIFTDGACSGNPGPGGWGAILRYNEHEKEISGVEAVTTNNRMEISAVIGALSLLKEPCNVTLYSDSQYVCNALKLGWAKKWKANGWMRNKKEKALNPELWDKLLSLCDIHNVDVVWVKGHAGHPENERCDRLAVAEAHKFSKVRLTDFYIDIDRRLSSMRYIYADNSATTAISPTVLEKMMPVLTEYYGNPSSLYRIGGKAKEILENSRENIAKNLGAANANEIYFTSGGSESDNWALKGVCRALKAKGKKHIITSKFEHHAILHTCQTLEKEGFEVTYLDVYENGIVHPEDVENAIREDTAIVSIMYANNEIGTIQPITEIGAICKKHKVIFHTDAVQAAGYIKINVQEQNIDMLSMTAHKLHGPKGIGLLYVRRGIRLENLIDGGAQERNKRAGTENVAGVVGLDAALQEAVDTMDERREHLEKLRDRLIDGLLKIERSRVNGDRVHRLPGNVNMCFEGIEGESLLLRLDMNGISASSGSACTSGSLDPSHVLLAIGLPHEIAHGSMRLSFSAELTDEDVDYMLEVIPQVVTYLRNMSPLWEKIKKQEAQEALNK